MMNRKGLSTFLIIGLALGIAFLVALLAAPGSRAEDEESGGSIRGAGTTIVEGGTGAPSFTPLITKVAFHWEDGAGRFECLALAPSAPAGDAGSGNFDTNVMYVTGEITSAEVREQRAVLRGSATVTGVGAGSNQPFTVTVAPGGPGATLVLDVSGLTFSEILLEGQFRF